jgi:hypothetical protein
MGADQPREELRERIETLENKNQQLRERIEELEYQPSLSRRSLIRGGTGVVGIGLLTLLFGSAAADPQGTYPLETDDPFSKIRAQRTDYYAMTSEPATPPSGVVTVYIRDGDL